MPTENELRLREAFKLERQKRRAERKHKLSDEEEQLLALVPDLLDEITPAEQRKLPEDLQTLQSDYANCRRLGIRFFVAGETQERRTARIFSAFLKALEIDESDEEVVNAHIKKQSNGLALLNRSLASLPNTETPLPESAEPPATIPGGAPEGVPTMTVAEENEVLFRRELDGGREELKRVGSRPPFL